jgi:ParB family chromosome partitioning protein
MGVPLDLSGLEQFKASALLTERGGGAPMEVPLDLIDLDPKQPRRTLNEATLADLAASIKAQGVLEPVSLRSDPDKDGRYIVNRGERRVRASRLAGRSSVPAFLDERLDPYAQAIENMQREDLSPFDLARFIAEREAEGDARATIARKLHKPASFVTEVASLVDTPADVRAAFDSGRVRDVRVLYQLARSVRDRRSTVEPLLAGAGPITREMLDATRVTDAPKSGSNPAPAGRVVRASRHADALLVEHDGRRGRLGWNGWPGKRTGEVCFDDGTHQMLTLAELKLIAWTAR